MDYQKIFLLENLKLTLNWKEKIILHLLRNYTYKIYVKGIRKGFNEEY